MLIIKLDAIDSTNDYLKTIVSEKTLEDYTVVLANRQLKGKGQRGTTWQTEAGKNLTVSVFKRFNKLDLEQQFYVSMATALSICDALKTFQISRPSIKWPNDILSENKKLCGILIENIVKQNCFEGSVIGFGLNVNQKFFKDLPNATSLTNITGIIFNKDEVLSVILKRLKFYFDRLEAGHFDFIKTEYENLLFRKDKPSTFKDGNGLSFSGIIKGTTKTGELKIWQEDDIIKTYNIKDVSLIY